MSSAGASMANSSRGFTGLFYRPKEGQETFGTDMTAVISSLQQGIRLAEEGSDVERRPCTRWHATRLPPPRTPRSRRLLLLLLLRSPSARWSAGDQRCRPLQFTSPAHTMAAQPAAANSTPATRYHAPPRALASGRATSRSAASSSATSNSTKPDQPRRRCQRGNAARALREQERYRAQSERD